MRYHWGLGVGHLHAHQPSAMACHIPEARGGELQDFLSERISGEDDTNMQILDRNNNAGDSDNPELALEDNNSEGWDDVESSDSKDGSTHEDTEEEEFAGL